VLARGYAVVQKATSGEVVRSVTQVVADERLNIRVSDGEFRAHAAEL
jgi:exonuclease VII large subunit